MPHYDHAAAARKKKAAEEYAKLKTYLLQRSMPKKSEITERYNFEGGKMHTEMVSAEEIEANRQKEEAEKVDLKSIDLGAALEHINSIEKNLAETAKELTEQNRILGDFDALLSRKHKRPFVRDPLNTPLT